MNRVQTQHTRPTTTFSSLLGRLARPLRSRKVRVAIATALGALAAEYGLDVPGEFLLVVVGIGASLILGIAHEDAGRHAASRPTFSASAAPDAFDLTPMATAERRPPS